MRNLLKVLTYHVVHLKWSTCSRWLGWRTPVTLECFVCNMSANAYSALFVYSMWKLGFQYMATTTHTTYRTSYVWRYESERLRGGDKCVWFSLYSMQSVCSCHPFKLYIPRVHCQVLMSDTSLKHTTHATQDFVRRQNNSKFCLRCVYFIFWRIYNMWTVTVNRCRKRLSK